MTRLFYDLRFALRSLAKRPAFSLLVVVILGLGIGATTAVVDLANLLAWRPIPVDHPEELVRVFTAGNQGFVTPFRGTGFPDYEDYRDGARSLAGLAAGNLWELRVDTGGATEMLWTAGVTGNYFEVLRLRTSLGRGLTKDDDRTGAEPVAVISHPLWRRLGSDRDILGRTLKIEGQPVTVVGVGPRGFRGPTAANVQDVYLSLSAVSVVLGEGQGELFTERERGSFEVIGRLAAGESLEQAQAELDVLAQQIDHEHPMSDGYPRQVTVTEGNIVHPIDVERLESTLGLFAAAVAVLLLITCANVAHLLLARAMGRRREMAVRLSIGAGRGALVRQLLTEGLLLSLAGGTCGLLVTRGARALLASIAGPEFAVEMHFDGRVLGLTLLVCLVVTVLFGLAPALAATRVALASALKDGSPGGGRRRFVAGKVLGAGQVALSVVLLVSGALLIESLYRQLTADLGFDDEHLYIARLTLPDSEYSPDTGTVFFDRLLERTRALPGVESAGLGLIVPPILFDVTVPLRLPGGDEDVASSRVNLIEPGYLETMDIRLLRGRGFAATDTRSSQPVALVNELLAEQLFPGQDPVGQAFEYHGRPGDPGPGHVVVGVVSNVTQQRAKAGGEPMVYFSWSQRPRPNRQLVVRSTLGAATVFESLRGTLRDLDPNLALTHLRTGKTNRSEALAIERMQAQAVGVFAGFGFLLAVVGIFGVLSYSVSHRVREIGIRMAVGARGFDVRRQIVGQGLRLAVAGSLVGVVATLLTARFLESLLYGVKARDPWVVAAVLVVVLLSTAAAAYLPARRASKLDPLQALRYE